MAVAAEIGRNIVSKHQIQPEVWRMSRLTDGSAEPISPDQNSQARTGTGNLPCSLTTITIGNLTDRLIHTLLEVMNIHTYIHPPPLCEGTIEVGQEHTRSIDV